jgi:hypothetical protein
VEHGDRADPARVRAPDLARRVADGHARACRPPAGPGAREVEELGPRLGVAAEGSFSRPEETREPQPLHPRPRHGLRVARQQREALAGRIEASKRALGTGRGPPGRRVCGSEEHQVAVREASAPAGEGAVDLGVLEPGPSKHQPRDP